MNPVPSLYAYNCSVVDTERLRRGEKKPVGYLQSFRIPSSGFEVRQDIDVRDPTKHDVRESIVGILEYVGWGSQADEPLHLRGRVSRANAGSLEYRLDKIRSQADVLFNLCVYEWCDELDYYHGGYFATFRTENGPLKARVMDFKISKIEASDDFRYADNLFSITLLGVDPTADSERKQTIFCPKIRDRPSGLCIVIGSREYDEVPFGVHPSFFEMLK
ncbi:MAG: hypothetical protein LLG04_08395 [Parachlamydia sp.]|nr:hypothetical protein [Parachlamydia sp.]